MQCERSLNLKLKILPFSLGAKKAFRKLKKPLSFEVPYDYTSIMHYPWNAFSKNGKNTMKALKEVKKQPYLTVGKIDVLRTNMMYGCGK